MLNPRSLLTGLLEVARTLLALAELGAVYVSGVAMLIATWEVYFSHDAHPDWTPLVMAILAIRGLVHWKANVARFG